jgi:hypothetical protein
VTPITQAPLRWFGASALVATAGWLLAPPLVALLLPFLDLICDLLQRDFLTHLRLDASSQDAVVRMTGTALHPIVVGGVGVILPSHDFGTVSVAVVHVVVPIVILGTFLVGWPLRSVRELAFRCVAGLVAVPLMLVPSALLLVGRMDALLGNGAADAPGRSVIDLMLFMELGGRWLAALVAGALAVIGARRADVALIDSAARLE